MKTPTSLALLIAGLLVLPACSLDVLPIHYSQLNSARKAAQPIPRGPHAPGAFKRVWSFAQNRGYEFDPNQVQIRDGFARLKSIPAKGRAIVESSSGVPYAALDAFSEVTGPEHKGAVKYQLSNDGATWYFHDGKHWTVAGPQADQANTASEVNSAIPNFHQEAGAGSLYVRAFLLAPTGTETVELKSFQAEGVAPSMDGWK